MPRRLSRISTFSFLGCPAYSPSPPRHPLPSFAPLTLIYLLPLTSSHPYPLLSPIPPLLSLPHHSSIFRSLFSLSHARPPWRSVPRGARQPFRRRRRRPIWWPWRAHAVAPTQAARRRLRRRRRRRRARPPGGGARSPAHTAAAMDHKPLILQGLEMDT